MLNLFSQDSSNPPVAYFYSNNPK